ncbi:MAG TPA: flagellar basal body L-ring protein FlgH [Alphaproteobacteria bacterium]
MIRRPAPRLRPLLAVSAALLLGACSAAERLGQVGRAPDFDPIINPIQKPDYAPVTMPMPAPEIASHQANSLWRTGARAFFKDQRAAQVGDILTIEIAIDDGATISNETTRSRDNLESSKVSSLFGYEASFAQVLPEAVDPTNLLSIDTDLSNKGSGEIKRGEQIDLKLAAIVTQILPNGNMVIEGHQEVLVNYDLRALNLRGIVRPEDISASNTISYEKIADARISYGGRGQLHDVQQPRYGSQVLDVINPF